MMIVIKGEELLVLLVEPPPELLIVVLLPAGPPFKPLPLLKTPPLPCVTFFFLPLGLFSIISHPCSLLL